MNLAYRLQNLQDLLTQQWVISTGRRYNALQDNWLNGPFGELNGIGEEFIHQLAKKEQLSINRNVTSLGLFSTIKQLNLKQEQLENLSEKVIDFYEHTSNFDLSLEVKWNPFFRFFGLIVNRLFSKRIDQLNIPLQNNDQEKLSSEIIQLIDLKTKEIKYTIWLRKNVNNGQVIYSGIYTTCILPSKKTCVKAVFPLPMGNATVLLKPSVGQNKELILDCSGKKYGDPGFYFLVKDSKNNNWANFVRSFTDTLIIQEKYGGLLAKQTLRLWSVKVVNLTYIINPKQ